jgi:hypothetical protein
LYVGAVDTELRRQTEAGLELVEALKIRRTLADKNPDRYLPYVASTLNNVSFLVILDYELCERLVTLRR